MNCRERDTKSRVGESVRPSSRHFSTCCLCGIFHSFCLQILGKTVKKLLLHHVASKLENWELAQNCPFETLHIDVKENI